LKKTLFIFHLQQQRHEQWVSFSEIVGCSIVQQVFLEQVLSLVQLMQPLLLLATRKLVLLPAQISIVSNPNLSPLFLLQLNQTRLGQTRLGQTRLGKPRLGQTRLG
jgi:hypothetical protein